MQQFKTYPGIPPSGVVERPSVLRIPPHPTGVLLHLTGNFGRIKWYYGREKPCISGYICPTIALPPRSLRSWISMTRNRSRALRCSLFLAPCARAHMRTREVKFARNHPREMEADGVGGCQ